MGTELERARTFDLTRSPSEQWNEEMLALVGATVLKGASTKAEQYYCLAVADSLNLNPFIDEIYFIKVKSRDGGGKVLKPYIGRNGLVAKATERGAYYQSAAVHENDRFEIEVTSTGRTKMTHRYGAKDRGPVIGAYAFLHGSSWKIPAFRYIDIEEYKPTFDEQWKEDASPWYNQTSAMAEKCAMIVAGRERLPLGNVLADGEIERVVQQTEAGPTRPTLAEGTPAEFDYDALAVLVSDPAGVRGLRATVEEANELDPVAWTPAKLEMVTAGMDAGDVAGLTARIRRDVEAVRTRTGRSPVSEAVDVQSPAEGARSPGAAPVAVAGDVIDVAPMSDRDAQRVASLEDQIQGLSDLLDAMGDDDPSRASEISDEMAHLEREANAIRNAAQSSLL